VKQFAIDHNIPVAQPISLRLDGKYPDQAQEAHALLRSTPHDVMVVAAYGLILPESVLSIPPLGCLNIHASLLPRWRGAAPIHRAIEAGDQQTGITIMQMDRGLDTGAMLSIEAMPIAPDDSTASLHDKLALLGGKMIVDTLQQLSVASIKSTPQPEQGVCYAAKISKEEAALDFTLPATVLSQKIRAFNPFPAACGVVNGVTLKIWRAEVVDKPASAQVGQLMLQDQRLLVACGEGALSLLELQKPGGKRLPTTEFLKGFSLNEQDFFK
jgi:methionyl-tRNA formyltransferase